MNPDTLNDILHQLGIFAIKDGNQRVTPNTLIKVNLRTKEEPRMTMVSGLLTKYDKVWLVDFIN